MPHVSALPPFWTDECSCKVSDLGGGPLDEWIVEANYTGPGRVVSAWTQSYNGPVRHGNFGADGGFAITNEDTGFIPTLSGDDTITFAFQIQDAGYVETELSPVCIDLNAEGGGQGVVVSQGCAFVAAIDCDNEDCEEDAISVIMIDQSGEIFYENCGIIASGEIFVGDETDLRIDENESLELENGEIRLIRFSTLDP